MVFCSVQLCKIIIDMPKITKMDAFSLLQSETFISMMKNLHSHSLQPKVRTMLQCSAKFTMVPSKNKKRRDKQTSKIRSVQYIQNSNFRFKSREKRTQGSERCEKDRTAKITSKFQVYACWRVTWKFIHLTSHNNSTKRAEQRYATTTSLAAALPFRTVHNLHCHHRRALCVVRKTEPKIYKHSSLLKERGTVSVIVETQQQPQQQQLLCCLVYYNENVVRLRYDTVTRNFGGSATNLKNDLTDDSLQETTSGP
jgi:hypothetical protein